MPLGILHYKKKYTISKFLPPSVKVPKHSMCGALLYVLYYRITITYTLMCKNQFNVVGWSANNLSFFIYCYLVYLWKWTIFCKLIYKTIYYVTRIASKRINDIWKLYIFEVKNENPTDKIENNTNSKTKLCWTAFKPMFNQNRTFNILF